MQLQKRESASRTDCMPMQDHANIKQRCAEVTMTARNTGKAVFNCPEPVPLPAQAAAIPRIFSKESGVGWPAERKRGQHEMDHGSSRTYIYMCKRATTCSDVRWEGSRSGAMGDVLTCVGRAASTAAALRLSHGCSAARKNSFFKRVVIEHKRSYSLKRQDLEADAAVCAAVAPSRCAVIL
eukprot:2512090-Pleurochrysis_carterae.AAC.1